MTIKISTEQFEFKPADINPGRASVLWMDLNKQELLGIRHTVMNRTPIIIKSEATGKEVGFVYFSCNRDRSAYFTEESWLQNNGTWYRYNPTGVRHNDFRHKVMVRFKDD